LEITIIYGSLHFSLLVRFDRIGFQKLVTTERSRPASLPGIATDKKWILRVANLTKNLSGKSLDVLHHVGSPLLIAHHTP
jgi:hypothetical protein